MTAGPLVCPRTGREKKKKRRRKKMEEEERKREGRLSTLHVLVELFPNPRRDLNGCQSFPVLGLVAREKLPCKGVKLAPVGPFLANNESLGHECWLRKRITNDLYTRLEKRSSLSLSPLFDREPDFSRPPFPSIF